MKINQVKQKYQSRIMSIPGVIGIGIGAEGDEQVITVLVVRKNADLEKKIPSRLDGFRVVIRETGQVRAL